MNKQITPKKLSFQPNNQKNEKPITTHNLESKNKECNQVKVSCQEEQLLAAKTKEEVKLET